MGNNQKAASGLLFLFRHKIKGRAYLLILKDEKPGHDKTHIIPVNFPAHHPIYTGSNAAAHKV
jgi:hypothetical protein